MEKYSISSLNKVVRGSKRATYDVATVHAILDDAFLCHIGYVYQNQAIVIPIAYARKGDVIYIHGSLKNRMLLSLLEAGTASLTVTHLDGLVLARSAFHHSANYRSVTVFGSVNRIEEPKDKMEALKAIVDQMIPNHWDTTRQLSEKELNATLVIEIQIETASAKVRAEGAVDEVGDYDLPIWAGVIPIQQKALEAISDDKLLDSIKIPESVTNYIKTH